MTHNYNLLSTPKTCSCKFNVLIYLCLLNTKNHCIQSIDLVYLSHHFTGAVVLNSFDTTRLRDRKAEN